MLEGSANLICRSCDEKVVQLAVIRQVFDGFRHGSVHCIVLVKLLDSVIQGVKCIPDAESESKVGCIDVLRHLGFLLHAVGRACVDPFQDDRA